MSNSSKKNDKIIEEIKKDIDKSDFLSDFEKKMEIINKIYDSMDDRANLVSFNDLNQIITI